MAARRVKIKLARDLRKNQTKTEKILWWILRNSKMIGYKFRRQYPIKGFILDFYCSSAKLGIEIDGGIHLKRKDYDQARQKVIENSGIKVLRFNNSEIYDHPEDVLIKIMQAVSDPALSTKWRGGTPSMARGG